MQDVRVLVADQLEDVVVEVGERRARVRRGGVGVDQVVEERRGVAVGEVGVVLDDDLRPLTRLVIEQRHQPAVRLFRGARDLLRVPVHPLMEVHLKMRRLYRFPHKSRIKRCGWKGNQQDPKRTAEARRARSFFFKKRDFLRVLCASAVRLKPFHAVRNCADFCGMPARNFSSRSAINSGCSMGDTWVPPGTVSSSEPGMRSCISSESQ